MAKNTETLGLEMSRLLSEAQKYFDQAKALASEREKWHAGWMEAEAKVSELEAERDALKAKNKKLREALAPFSEEASWWFVKNYDASEPVVEGFADYNGVMTCGDLFRARAALQEIPDD
jgi:hypothetical protein